MDLPEKFQIVKFYDSQFKNYCNQIIIARYLITIALNLKIIADK